VLAHALPPAAGDQPTNGRITFSEGDAMRRLWYLFVLVLATLLGPPANAVAAPPDTGHFPIEEHFPVLEPESSVCGFPISWDVSGQGTFQVFFDSDGNPTGVHVLGATSGQLSANGITLRTQQANNRHYDLVQNTVVETGIVSKYLLPGTGVVLMDRGRLVWNIDPETGEMVGAPVFEAGPHPSLHGDFGELCAVLTP
jgi:hypothetical protein